MKNKNLCTIPQYCGYFPLRILSELSTVPTIKIMIYVFTKCAMNKNINAIKISQKTIGGLGRMAFYRGLKDLEKNLWITVDRSDCHEYSVAIHPNYKYTKVELNFLEGKRG